MKEIIGEKEVIIASLQEPMTKLRTPLMSAKLRQKTVLRPRLQNGTRWSSTVLMLQRHAQLRKHVKRLDDVKIEVFLLSPAVERKVDVLIGKLAELDEVTKKLQCSDATIRITRVYFEAVLENYPNLSKRLGPAARVVKHPSLGYGILKLRNGHEEALITDKKEQVGGTNTWQERRPQSDHQSELHCEMSD